jgi:phosphate:Na+ symporter
VARQLNEMSDTTSEKSAEMLKELYVTIQKSVELTVQALRNNDQLAAESVLMLKETIRAQSDRLISRKAERLTADDPEYLTLVRLQMAFVDHMRRIYSLARRITRDILPVALAKME